MRSERFSKNGLKNSPKIVAVKFLFMLMVALNLWTEMTDADLSVEKIVANNQLRAVTLELGSQNTVNSQPAGLWFQTVGIIPAGFDVRSVRLKNIGELDYKITGGYQQIGGSEIACDQLKIKLIGLTGEVKYDGKINQFNWETEIKSGSEENLIGILQLTGGGGQNLSCQFDLVFKTKRPNQGESGGFRDEKRLTNLVTLAN